jgi:hypothetical protein
MRTIYLSGTKEAVLKDLRKLSPELEESNSPEISGEGFAAHWIGQIMTTPPELDSKGNVISEAVITENHHANIWVFDDLLELPIFETQLEKAPINPVNVLA